MRFVSHNYHPFCVLGIILGLIGCSNQAENSTGELVAERADDSWKSPASCVECHAEIVENWKTSYHAHAQRER